MCKNVEGLNGKAGRAVDWAVTIARIITPLILTGMAFLWWNHEERISRVSRDVAVMQGNRFTAADGFEVVKMIADLQARLDGKADAIGAVPVRETLSDHAERIRELERGD